MNVHYKYDDKGNEVELKGYDAYYLKGNNLEFHYVVEYNENGQRTKMEEKTGNHPFGYYLSGYSIEVTTYDENKNLIQEEHIRNNETVGFIRYIYLYDSQGNWVKRETYSGNNEEDLSKRLTEERIIEYY